MPSSAAEAAVISGREELIVLADADGRPIGTAEKWPSPHAATPLHPAFSCYVFDAAGAFLMNRRATTNTGRCAACSAWRRS